MSKTEHDVLVAAAEAALQAPSVFNTQPWNWQVDANALELRADRDRLLTATDPDGHLLMLSCGAALHHARVALAASGWLVVVDRFPDPAEADLLARIRLSQLMEPRAEDVALCDAISRRRTDRRPYGDEPVPKAIVVQLINAAAAQGAHAHETRPDQMPMLAVAVASAQGRESTDPAYVNELMRWTNRPPWSHDGVPPSTAVAHAPRRVPIRDFAVKPYAGMSVEPGGDRGASYLIISGDADNDMDWLRGGEATSAVLLTAVSLGLAAAPISDVIEVERTRDLVRRLVGAGSHPYLVIRCGVPTDLSTIDPAPRRDAADTIKGAPPWSTL